MENQVYNWFIKSGNIQIQKEGDCISLQLDYEKEVYCLLTHSDAYEIIDLLTNISKKIWENPNYQRQPYTNRLFKHRGNEYYWEIESSQIIIKYNETDDAIEIKYKGNNRMNLELNYVIEIIQIMEQLSK
ncbi:hypothetical protein OIU83_22525 [Flavobacterium sp. LS1R49]|uniref:Uncharacterized protein n=1 Tax=Flavobacterium shii TaxID=2987687 RepID=A0A9X2YXB9_9FLAO|nr:hypothetical protein [Flavobacterium shii]MCV9930453.1 hypothetical protein [Flavobacterium shii]